MSLSVEIPKHFFLDSRIRMIAKIPCYSQLWTGYFEVLLCLLYYHFGLTGTEAKAMAMAWAEVLFFLISLFYFFGRASQHVDSSFLDQGSNSCTPKWNLGVLNTALQASRRVGF